MIGYAPRARAKIEEKVMVATVRLGLFGAGRIGQFHAATIAHKSAGVALGAIVDAVPAAAERLATATGTANWGTDPEVILGDPAIDAVVIASPGPTHAGLIRAAAARGKPIFCEKPLSLDLAECDAAIAAAREARVPLQLGFQRRFDAGYVRAKALIDAGELGTLQTLHSRTRDPQPPPIEYLRTCGGLFRDTAVHDLDAIRFLAGGNVTRVYAVAAARVDPGVIEVGDIDSGLVVLTLDNGVIATVDISRQAIYGYDVRAEVFGTNGAVEIANPAMTHVVHRSRAGVAHDHVHHFLDLFGAAYEAEIRAFVACVRDGTTPRVTGEDGRWATVLAEAAQRSLERGEPVDV
jgi:myo-inositol 2-dehydrogenase/D-chiro-inositol 1-dehydrogenase